ENVCMGAPTAIPSPPSYDPVDPFTIFDGTNMEGDWTLTVSDNALGDTGVLAGWCVTITWQ
ncbi:MAG TPA: proprotein convertase P-domain-containing protein, partial [Enhygromyxa sp.]|nr:proprotein convertase P-domain-containing protein [Enhygromyxa sp.]